jgi:hypothetical protein
MLLPGLTQEALSPQHAFVVQFRANTDFAFGQSHGRVEHVLSGRATTFTSFDELAAFMTQVVTDLRRTAVQESTRPHAYDGKSR